MMTLRIKEKTENGYDLNNGNGITQYDDIKNSKMQNAKHQT